MGEWVSMNKEKRKSKRMISDQLMDKHTTVLMTRGRRRMRSRQTGSDRQIEKQTD